MITSLLAAVVVMVSGPDESMLMVPGKVNGYIMLPPKAVCEGQIRSINWSADSQYLVANRTQFVISKQIVKKMLSGDADSKGPAAPVPFDPVKHSVVVWDAIASKLTQVWAGNTSADDCEQVALIGQTLYLLVHQSIEDTGVPGTYTEQQSLLRCSMAGGPLQIVRSFEAGASFSIIAADQISRSIYLEGTTSKGSHVEAMISNAGFTIVQDQKQIPESLLATSRTNQREWIGDSGEAAPRSFEPPPSMAPSVANPEKPKAKAADLQLSIRVLTSSTKEVKTPISALVFDNPAKPGKDFGIIASGVGKAFALSPDNSSLAYSIDNVLVVRDIAVAPIDVIKNAREAAERTTTMSNAKQVGLAMMMYACDNDDVLPANLSNDQILPYIKNSDLLNGFVMTWTGGNISEIKSPAETELGYVTGPGGRAIIYADGHVKWKAD